MVLRDAYMRQNMKADSQFRNESPEFWANVRVIGEKCGYATKRTKKNPVRKIKAHSVKDMTSALVKIGLGTDHLVDPSSGNATTLATQLESYFEYRRHVLASVVEPNLMCRKCAKRTFEQLRRALGSTMPVPMNKQTGHKMQPAYLTGIVNMIIEDNIGGRPCNYNPRNLTTYSFNGAPLATLSRRHDGGFPSINNPIAVWEVKEYYYTTTFGSKISDGVYVTQLDGLEIEVVRNSGIETQLVLMVDAYDTWWNQGFSYLCRLIDLLHMGYVDEIFFGTEVISELPHTIKLWVAAYDSGVYISSPPASGLP